MSARSRRRSIKVVWLKCYTCGAMVEMGDEGDTKGFTCSNDEGRRWYCPKCSATTSPVCLNCGSPQDFERNVCNDCPPISTPISMKPAPECDGPDCPDCGAQGAKDLGDAVECKACGIIPL